MPHHIIPLEEAGRELGHQFNGAEGTKCVSPLGKPKGAALRAGVAVAAECHRPSQTYPSAPQLRFAGECRWRRYPGARPAAPKTLTPGWGGGFTRLPRPPSTSRRTAQGSGKAAQSRPRQAVGAEPAGPPGQRLPRAAGEER